MIYSLASSMVVMVASMTTVSNAYWVPDEAYLFKREEPTKSNSTPEASKTTPPKKEPSNSVSSKKESPSSKKEVSSKTTSQHASATSSAIVPTFVGSAPSTASPTSTAVASSSGTPLAVEGKSSSTGAIVGGVIAAIVAVGGIAAFVIMRKRKKARQASRSNQKPDPFTMGFGSDNYNNNFPPQQTYKKENTNSFDNYEVTPISASSKQAIQQYQPPPPPQQPPVVAPPPATSASLGSFVVIATYIPTLSDELEIETGDRIELVVEYDDGWCQGINLTKGHTKGVFPRHCIDYATAPSAHNNTSNVERSKRVSSMMYQ